MKRSLLISFGVLIGLGALAQEHVEPVIVKDCYATKISANGEWMGCYGMSALIYNIKTSESNWMPECQLGLGNSIADSGLAVGYTDEYGAIMKGDSYEVPVPLRDKGFSSINGITRDGSRITGYVMNPKLDDFEGDPFDENMVIYVPFYCDMDAEGNLGEIQYLPYPDKDFMGSRPQYVTGVWISDDGKTIAGIMIDATGRMEVPVTFHEDENGNWTYDTPSKKFFNPDGIVIPENPWIKAPSEPSFKEFMYPEQYEIYLEWINDYLTGSASEPDPFDLMTEEQIEAYYEAYDYYKNYYVDHAAEFKDYDEAYVKVLSNSPLFGEVTMNAAGTKIASAATYYDQEASGVSYVYIFDLTTGESQIIRTPVSGINVTQLLNDGTLLARIGMFSYVPAQTYILLPDADNFITIQDYFATTHPDYLVWMEETIPVSSGLMSVSDNMEVFASGVEFVSLADPDMFGDVTILSYIFSSNQGAGVENIEAINSEKMFRVFNLQGVKVLETTNKEDLNSLNKGIYIVNGRKVAI